MGKTLKKQRHDWDDEAGYHNDYEDYTIDNRKHEDQRKRKDRKKREFVEDFEEQQVNYGHR